MFINDLFLLYGRTFNYKFMTYLTSYCIYTAATINIYDIKNPKSSSVVPNAAERLSVSLQVLEREALQAPGIHRSIDIIKAQLRTWNNPPKGILLSPLSQSTGQVHLGNSNLVESSASRDSLLDPSPPSHVVTDVSNDTLVQQVQPTRVPDDGDLDGILMGAGGGFQPNAFHWTLDDTWDLDLQFSAE